MLAVLTVTGCATTVDGEAQRSGAGGPLPLTRLLPTTAEVAAAVGDPLQPAGLAKAGGVDVLPNGIRDSADATPLDCLGVVTPLMRVVYEGGGVRGAAWRDFSRFGAGSTVSSAEAGVVQMDSAEAAARMFARFSTQWQSCEGTTVTLHAGPGGMDLTATDVRVDGPVLTATILTDGGDGTVFPTERALAVARDYLFDVDVAITDPDPARRVPATRAAALVRVMAAKAESG